jgi:methyl-accepting chemotaxis protein
MMALQENKKTLNREQSKNFEKLQRGLNQFGPLLEDIIRIRSGEEWNIANYWVKTQATLVAFRIKELLNDMSANQEKLLENDVDEISSRTHFLIVLLVGLFFAAALISGVLAVSITRSISEPILDASKLANELVHGNFRKKRLPIQSKNELGTLSQSFNELLDKLQEENKNSKD